MRNASVRVRRVVEEQGGVIGRGQLRDCGLSSGTISRWIARGWLIRIHPRVYALGHAAISPRGGLIAALLYAGPESVLSHRTAAEHWGLVEGAPTGVVHVSVPVRRRSVAGVLVHRPLVIDRSRHEHLLVTSVARTLMDFAPAASDVELRRALANADYHDLLVPEELRSVMGRGHPGSARLRRALEAHMPELAMTLSPLEDLLLLLCERERVPLPVPNAKLDGYMPDGIWEAEMVIVEVDGAAAHSSPSQRRRDAERDMHFRSRGYLVFRYTYWQVTRKAKAIAAELLSALAKRNSAN